MRSLALPADDRQPPFRHVAVIGPGAIGSVFAVRLALLKGGPRVTLVDYRPDRAARLSGRPIVLHTPQGDLAAAVPVRLVPDGPVDLVILATKAPAARAAAEAARAWRGDAPVLVIQNGLGAAEEVADALPRAAVITGVSYQAAHRAAEGEVHHVANLETYLGYPGRGPDAAVLRVAALLSAAGLPARAEADLASLAWSKLLVNAALNPVAALAGVANGQVASRPSLRAMAEAIALEGQAVARAVGVALAFPDAAAAALTTARKTAANRCSMLQDLEAGRTTEIEYLNGALVRLAERHGVAVPANRAVATLIRQVSPGPRGAAT